MRPEGAPLPGAQSLATGLLGTGVLLVGSVVGAGLAATGHASGAFAHRHALVLLAALAAMAAWELGVVGVHRRNFDFSRARPWTPEATGRVARRTFALAATLALTTVAYVVLSHYGLALGGERLLHFAGSWYAPWFTLYFALCALLLVLGPAYFWLGERFGRWAPEEDDLLALERGYRALLGLRAPEAGFWGAQRANLVKFFFLPIMTVFLVGNAANFEGAVRDALLHAGPLLSADFLALAWDVAFHAMYLVDVALAVLGYTVALRLMDTHVRSADPTMSGWIVAVACYPPFNQLMDLYLGYRSGEHSWSGTLGDRTPLLLALGGAALVLVGIYALATVAFGLRFSNMTHRGIITRGPYAYVRHPAYAAKTLTWWLLSAPFLRGPGDTLRLALWTGIYVARALTEERHLRSDPEYRAYCEHVRWRFIPGVW